MAELERALIVERTPRRPACRKETDVRFGRPAKLSVENAKLAKRLLDEGKSGGRKDLRRGSLNHLLGNGIDNRTFVNVIFRIEPFRGVGQKPAIYVLSPRPGRDLQTEVEERWAAEAHPSLREGACASCYSDGLRSPMNGEIAVLLGSSTAAVTRIRDKQKIEAIRKIVAGDEPPHLRLRAALASRSPPRIVLFRYLRFLVLGSRPL